LLIKVKVKGAPLTHFIFNPNSAIMIGLQTAYHLQEARKAELSGHLKKLSLLVGINVKN
jgi:hypothetical protein